ncbi:DUF2062 domain-containing protein [Priestia megaterium]|uniref:Uncharacterized protein n=1 Tax=Priestia megaterium (strain ATCC 14581 / DSM 32 / CCUG 1817 / JCM 2506 / NBRC 15308 / NCIMB 9376 / NCTC 10342 / NRRL B-14308 / VKM B-512 / Ford 19) TaxID=1348623 RepID=A0A0B6ALL6_PRIM2|nr:MULTISPECIES: DUF2062 domain-containing protein [Priestia]AJI21483.1 hypothetical protein BG04_3932 [Priestia megaterium NBRC 15308 = ATCC 14581]KFM96883.1 hypothetical protein DJ91_1339 [Priestia megaterium]KGJ85066.1 hypothetical protein BMT_03075 [Priestia megaterium NBRC 15308 = ATCC 14581]MCU7709670.1 DUF2062 domain-containing protein [Priestia megaterium]MCW1045001.1 DUF2062 domain-containing protein [Priestia sp. JV24]
MNKIVVLKRRFKYLLIKLLRLKDHSHKVALGFSLGSVVNFVPTFGFGLIISVGLAKLCKGNSIAGLVGGMFFMWAFPLMFYLNTVVGGYIFPLDFDQTLLQSADGNLDNRLELGAKVGKNFLTGMFLNSFLFGSILYIVSYYIINQYRGFLLHYISKKWIIKKRTK